MGDLFDTKENLDNRRKILKAASEALHGAAVKWNGLDDLLPGALHRLGDAVHDAANRECVDCPLEEVCLDWYVLLGRLK